MQKKRVYRDIRIEDKTHIKHEKKTQKLSITSTNMSSLPDRVPKVIRDGAPFAGQTLVSSQGNLL